MKTEGRETSQKMWIFKKMKKPLLAGRFFKNCWEALEDN